MLGSTMSGIIPAPSHPDGSSAIWIDDAATAPALYICDDNIDNRLENHIDLKGTQCVRVRGARRFDRPESFRLCNILYAYRCFR